MKNLVLILIAVLGTAVASYAQDGTKKTEPNKKSETKKKATAESKKIAPVKKVN